MPRKQNANLKVLSPEEARKYGCKGGKASVEARAKMKTFRQIGQLMLTSKPQPELLAKLKTFYPEICEDWTLKDIIFHAQTHKALMGDTRAFEAVRDTIGEIVESKQSVELSGSVDTNDLSKLDTKTLLKMAKAAEVEVSEG